MGSVQSQKVDVRLIAATHRDLKSLAKSAFSFQGHPEASPGPNDVAPLFDRFINEMAHWVLPGLSM